MNWREEGWESEGGGMGRRDGEEGRRDGRNEGASRWKDKVKCRGVER